MAKNAHRVSCASVPTEPKKKLYPVHIGSKRTKTKHFVIAKKTHRVPYASVPTEQKKPTTVSLLKKHIVSHMHRSQPNKKITYYRSTVQHCSVHDHCSAPTALGALRGVFPKLADGRRPVTAPLSRRQPLVTMLVEVKDASNVEEEEDVGHIILAKMRDVVSLSDAYTF